MAELGVLGFCMAGAGIYGLENRISDKKLKRERSSRRGLQRRRIIYCCKTLDNGEIGQDGGSVAVVMKDSTPSRTIDLNGEAYGA